MKKILLSILFIFVFSTGYAEQSSFCPFGSHFNDFTLMAYCIKGDQMSCVIKAERAYKAGSITKQELCEEITDAIEYAGRYPSKGTIWMSGDKKLTYDDLLPYFKKAHSVYNCGSLPDPEPDPDPDPEPDPGADCDCSYIKSKLNAIINDLKELRDSL